MKDQFHGVDLANLTRLDEPPHGLYATHKTVRQIHAEEAIGRTSGIHDRAKLEAVEPDAIVDSAEELLAVL